MSLANQQNDHLDNRYVGLDVLKLLILFVIGGFHFSEAAYYQDMVFFQKEDSALFYYTFGIGRQFSFFGFAIIALATFLMGLKDNLKTITRKIYAFYALFIFGGFVLLPAFWGGFEWEIYHFLAVSIAALILIRKWGIKYIYIAGLLGFVMLWTPFWSLEFLLSDFDLLHEILLGVCDGQFNRGTWPLLPWLGLPVMSYASGLWVKNNRSKVSKWNKIDLLFIPVLVLSLPNAISPMGISPLGPGFYCYVNRIGPVVLWSNMIWVYFFMRVSLLDSVNSQLKRTPVINLIPRMQLSQSIALFYVLQLAVIQGIAKFPIFKQNAFVVGVMFYLLIPITELLSWSIKKIWKNAYFRWMKAPK